MSETKASPQDLRTVVDSRWRSGETGDEPRFWVKTVDISWRGGLRTERIAVTFLVSSHVYVVRENSPLFAGVDTLRDPPLDLAMALVGTSAACTVGNAFRGIVAKSLSIAASVAIVSSWHTGPRRLVGN